MSTDLENIFFPLLSKLLEIINEINYFCIRVEDKESRRDFDKHVFLVSGR